jgi:hypothetical protein
LNRIRFLVAQTPSGIVEINKMAIAFKTALLRAVPRINNAQTMKSPSPIGRTRVARLNKRPAERKNPNRAPSFARRVISIAVIIIRVKRVSEATLQH